MNGIIYSPELWKWRPDWPGKQSNDTVERSDSPLEVSAHVSAPGFFRNLPVEMEIIGE